MTDKTLEWLREITTHQPGCNYTMGHDCNCKMKLLKMAIVNLWNDGFARGKTENMSEQSALIDSNLGKFASDAAAKEFRRICCEEETIIEDIWRAANCPKCEDIGCNNCPKFDKHNVKLTSPPTSAGATEK